MSQAQTTVISVTIEVVANGFIVTPQTNQTPRMPGMNAPASTRQVYNDFPDACAAVAMLLGVTLPATAVSAAITAAQASSASASSAAASS